MKIKKVLNNNAVIALDRDANEVVVTGSGLAFKKSAGDIIDSSKIERIFSLEDKDVSKKLKKLIQDLPVEYVEIAEEIIVYAKRELNKNLNDNIYLTLTDHIHFLIERLEKKLTVSNPMSWEIRRFYPKEYKVGREAIRIIQSHFGYEIPEEEAASIAMHIVNAALGENMPNVITMIKIIQDTLSIIKYHYRIELDEDSLNYQRLVTHLQFFAQRIINSQGERNLDESDEQLFNLISNQYKTAYECTLKIKMYANEVHDFKVNKAELTYLIVHIEKVIQSSKQDLENNTTSKEGAFSGK